MDCAHTIVANIYRLIPFSVYLLPAIGYALFDKPMIRTTSPPFHKSGSNLPPHPSFAEDAPCGADLSIPTSFIASRFILLSKREKAQP